MRPILPFLLLLACRDAELRPTPEPLPNEPIEVVVNPGPTIGNPECVRDEEVCNGKDADCDGEVDEDQGYRGWFPEDAGVRPVGDCRPGLQECVKGQWTTTYDPVLPREEVKDCHDNDCDGAADEDYTEPIDVVIALDCSGSMGAIIGRVHSMLLKLPTVHSYALVGIPDWTGWHEPRLMHDFRVGGLDPAILATCDGRAGWMEPSLDGVSWVATNRIALGWLNAYRVQVNITDEMAQSYSGWTANSAGKAAADAGITEHVMTLETSAETFRPIWEQTGGQFFDLSAVKDGALDSVLKAPGCQ